ncbi:hypothetical protein BGZ61DRAFT_529797 [Ilyonectria robusta]|uniref:uncharacterized protein n=1 Tax=Ilyonectria robusta TaxID=1079257 RepID=UPI001E8E47E2|nr:uncharacterized protein BGZ61DRAFT_529797 [Ilyonectria robusta]KAH8729627.1 hypothetical protein BGZ61DRAFT_529797 [Ilyonectria robusta]
MDGSNGDVPRYPYWFITSSQMPDLPPVALQAKQACMLDEWCRWQRPDYEEVGKSHVVNLDFEARVPVPFSIFPSTYRDHESQTQTTTTTQVHEEVDIKPLQPKAGREGQYSSYSAATAEVVVPPREEQHYSEEEIRITREEEQYRRPGVQQQQQQQQHHHHHEHYQTEQYVREDRRRPEPASQYTTSHTQVEIDTRHPYYSTPIDIAERQYRERFRPSKPDFTADPPSRPQYQTQDTFQVNNYTVEGRPAPSQYKNTEKTEINNFTVEASSRPQYSSFEKTTETNNFTVEGRAPRQPQYKQSTQVNKFTVDTPVSRPSYQQDVKISEETVEPAKFTRPQKPSKMGYYDEDGHYHSFRAGAHKLADKIAHPRGHERVEVDIVRTGSRTGGEPDACLPNTVTIPCHHIRLGDFLMLQGRPCQVIRISTSSATGQYRYLGVDLFTKQLHEESSFISNPAPSVVVQTMLGPVFKQYRVLDMQDGLIVAMTETGDVKQGLPVIDQSNLYTRLNGAFESGRGSLRVLVLNDGGRELAVDMKVIHGSRL